MTPAEGTVRKNHIRKIGPGVLGLGVLGLVAFVLIIAISNHLRSPPASSLYPTTSPRLGIHDRVRLVRPSPGCFVRDDIERYEKLLVDQDWWAVDRMQSLCPHLDISATYTVAETPISENVCIRAKGDIDCQWTNKGWLEKLP